MVWIPPFAGHAQETGPGCAPGLSSSANRWDGLFCIFDLAHPAHYSGGENDMQAWLEEHIQYPPEAWRDSIEGDVVVSLIVEKDGRTSGVELCRDIGGGCGAEAVRVVRDMPGWIPGQVNGNPIRAWFNLKIHFRMALYAPERDYGDRVFHTDVGRPAVSPKGDRRAFVQFLNTRKGLIRRLKRHTTGRYVQVRLVVEKDGRLSPYDPEPADAAQLLLLRYAQSVGRWEPAQRRGKPVRSSVSISVLLRTGVPGGKKAGE